MAVVFVRGIEFRGRHGVTVAERAVVRRFRVDVELTVKESATESDSVADTVDYGAVAGMVVEVGEGEPFATVERLARVLADRLMHDHPTVSELTIEVAKLLPPIPASVDVAGVRLELRRKP